MNIAAEARSADRVAGVSMPGRGRFALVVSDALVMAKRNLMHIPRVPEQLIDVTLQPILFVVLFRYVFGGAIATGDTSYANFLIPGILLQLMIFGGMSTGVGLADDLKKGLMDRFRSLPMARSAVLAGRTIADLATSVIGVVVVLGAGLLTGFRPEGNPLKWFAAVGLGLLLTFTMSWIGAFIGLLARSVEAVQGVGFMVIFPLTFASSVFVPTETMPGWLQSFTDHQPVTVAANAVRALFLDQPAGDAVWQTFAWCAGLLLVFVPLSIRLFQRRTSV